jgi:hypothetical protein
MTAVCEVDGFSCLLTLCCGPPSQPHTLHAQAFFDDVLDASVSELNFKAIVDGLGDVLFQFPFRYAGAALTAVTCIPSALFLLGLHAHASNTRSVQSSHPELSILTCSL